MIRPVLATATLALLLASCGDKTAAPSSADDKRKAAGEVLGGSISDDMIPLDALTSTSPPMKIAPSSDDGGDAATKPEQPAADASPQAPPSETPAPKETVEN